VLLVPVVTALVLGGLRVNTELTKADEFSRAATQVDLSAKVSELVHEIQLERALVVGRIASSRTSDRAPVLAQLDSTDNKVTELRAAAASINNLDPAVRDLFTKSVARLDTLDTIRRLSEQTLLPAPDAISVYEDVISALLQLDREMIRVSDNRELSQQADTFDAIARAKEQAAIQNTILRAAALSNSFGPGQLSRLRAARAEFTAALSDFEQSATPAARARYASTVAGPEVDNRLRLQQIAENRGDANAPIALDVAAFDGAAKGTLVKIRNVEIASLDDLRKTARGLITTAQHNAIRDASIVGSALLIALLLMLVVARSLLRPLRVLRTNALDVANRRLPGTVQRILADPDPVAASRTAIEPVPVFTREETGQLARSFDAVHDQAVRMATEQALLRDNINSIFVNLSRRSQNLVERLLSVIDQLERDELDPDQLASLFEVDHLATRMRRNSESLLVLSGSGLSRQLSRPVLASEVVGAAVSEVEHYARIEVLSAPEVTVQGHAVNDLVHLIAELLDNAIFFAEADKKVVVRMAVTRRKELAIQITDQGAGMSAEEIDAANTRLADPPDLDVAVTRRMGLYVVARLAKRHNIVVRLRDNEDIEGGLIARITVPAELVSPAEFPAMTQPTPVVGRDAARISGIAGAFTTGSLPRLRGNGTPAAEPVRYNRRRTDPGYQGPDPVSLFGQPLPEADGSESALAAENPTQRLPLFEAVLSQWFSDGAEAPLPGTDAGMSELSAWNSPADEGWSAARDLLEHTGEEKLTAAGLPLRVRGARLLPGSAASRPQPEEPEAAPPLPPRSASVIRNRMSSYQQGVRRGRHYLTETYGEEQT
jgi:signal transduction histidine kinase